MHGFINETTAWVLFAAFAAGFIQGLSGFGSALVALPLLSMTLDIRPAVALVALLGLVVSLANLARHHRDLRLPPLYPLFIGALLGLAPGVLFLTRMPRPWVMLGMGLLLTGFALASLASSGHNPRLPRLFRNGLVMGLTSGALGGAYATNGPPAILHIASLGWTAARQKASLSAFFVATGLMMAASHWLGGVTDARVMGWFVTALPALALGTVAGIVLFHRLAGNNYRRLTLLLVLAMGVLMLVRSAAELSPL